MKTKSATESHVRIVHDRSLKMIGSATLSDLEALTREARRLGFADGATAFYYNPSSFLGDGPTIILSDHRQEG